MINTAHILTPAGNRWLLEESERRMNSLGGESAWVKQIEQTDFNSTDHTNGFKWENIGARQTNGGK